MVDLVDLAAAGDFAGAREIHLRLYPLFKTLFVETNPIPVKAAMALLGRIRPELRLPLLPMEAANQRLLQGVLQELGVL